ncbi:uncharacterized protein LOC129599336 [Paramacrobiotus metropolitanus]|uniref:uncharacterized protein LOC129599336 n=1 Tax=Paramacrobiotus metropolitanus TaxID=2943436 RepID=UPI002445DB29|nr:uncharacterized protein LOC129599336 [Paramacrobiotus metropolitanus]
MNPSASNAEATIALAIIQLLGGVIIFVADAIPLAVQYIPLTNFVGIILGLFYIVSGALGVAAGASQLKPVPSTGARCLAVSCFVLNIVSVLSSFSMLVWCSVILNSDAKLWLPKLPELIGQRFIKEFVGPS